MSEAQPSCSRLTPLMQPYLDEELTSYISSLPLWLICDLRESPGVGDKKILREVIATRLFVSLAAS